MNWIVCTNTVFAWQSLPEVGLIRLPFQSSFSPPFCPVAILVSVLPWRPFLVSCLSCLGPGAGDANCSTRRRPIQRCAGPRPSAARWAARHGWNRSERRPGVRWCRPGEDRKRDLVSCSRNSRNYGNMTLHMRIATMIFTIFLVVILILLYAVYTFYVVHFFGAVTSNRRVLKNAK